MGCLKGMGWTPICGQFLTLHRENGDEPVDVWGILFSDKPIYLIACRLILGDYAPHVTMVPLGWYPPIQVESRDFCVQDKKTNFGNLRSDIHCDLHLRLASIQNIFLAIF